MADSKATPLVAMQSRGKCAPLNIDLVTFNLKHFYTCCAARKKEEISYQGSQGSQGSLGFLKVP